MVARQKWVAASTAFVLAAILFGWRGPRPDREPVYEYVPAPVVSDARSDSSGLPPDTVVSPYRATGVYRWHIEWNDPMLGLIIPVALIGAGCFVLAIPRKRDP